MGDELSFSFFPEDVRDRARDQSGVMGSDSSSDTLLEYQTTIAAHQKKN